MFSPRSPNRDNFSLFGFGDSPDKSNPAVETAHDEALSANILQGLKTIRHEIQNLHQNSNNSSSVGRVDSVNSVPPIPTQNRFSVLSPPLKNGNQQPSNTTSTTSSKRRRDGDDSNPTQSKPKQSKPSNNNSNSLNVSKSEQSPPPIVLKDRKYFPRVEVHLKTLRLKGRFEAVVMGTKLAIKTSHPDDYKKVLQYVTDQKIEYYTRKLPQDKVKRYVIRGIVPESDLSEVKLELTDMGYHILKVLPMTKRDGTLLPLCIIETPFTDDNHDITEVTNILHQKVKVEEEYYRGPPICANCHEYSHSKNRCSFKPTCPTCIVDHPPGECKQDPSNPQCRRCKGFGHKPTYKGCPKYQEYCRRHGKQIDKNVQRTFQPAPKANPWQNKNTEELAAPQHHSTPKKPKQTPSKRPVSGSGKKQTKAQKVQFQKPSTSAEQPTSKPKSEPSKTTTPISKPSNSKNLETETQATPMKSTSDEFSIKDLIGLVKQVVEVIRIYKKYGIMAALDALIPILEKL